MFDARVIFALTVSFLTDFLTGFATGLGGGVATTATGDGAALTIPGLPPKYVWVVALIGGLLAGLRGLQKNLSLPIAPAPAVAAITMTTMGPPRRAPDA